MSVLFERRPARMTVGRQSIRKPCGVRKLGLAWFGNGCVLRRIRVPHPTPARSARERRSRRVDEERTRVALGVSVVRIVWSARFLFSSGEAVFATQVAESISALDIIRPDQTVIIPLRKEAALATCADSLAAPTLGEN